jgi:hypothetical protein
LNLWWARFSHDGRKKSSQRQKIIWRKSGMLKTENFCSI